MIYVFLSSMTGYGNYAGKPTREVASQAHKALS